LAVAFSPDGRTVAAGGYDPEVRCWTTRGGTPGPTFGGWAGAVRALVFSRDSRKLYGGGEEGRLREFDLDTGKDRTLAECPDTVRALALTPDGGTLVAAPWHQGRIRLLSAADGKLKGELETSTGEYPSLAVNRTGTLIAAGGMGRHLKLWETGTGKVRTELPGPHEAPIMGVAFSPDGAWLVSVDGRHDDESAPCRIKLWDVEKGREVARLELPKGCFFGAVFAADGRSCYAALHDGTVRHYALPIRP
jgi:WD40 repeat protein